MTKKELQEKYPNVYREFEAYFIREGWGADSADDLSEYGFETWFLDFQYEVGDIEDYEKELSDNK